MTRTTIELNIPHDSAELIERRTIAVVHEADQKEARKSELSLLREANARMARALELVDGAIDNQVYGLKRSSSSDAYGRREAGLDLAPEYEHDVIITEALWDIIRSALEG